MGAFSLIVVINLLNSSWKCIMDSLKTLSLSATATAGALTGFSVRLIVNPLDVIKIRWQLQVEPISGSFSFQNYGKYNSWSQTIRSIVAEEGIKALWKGHLSGQILTIGYSSIQFTTYKFLSGGADYRQNFGVHFLLGGVSGCAATVGTLPIDLIRTRMVSQGNKVIYKSISDAFASIYKVDGARGYFRGLSPALVQIFPFSGLTFGVYNLIRKPMQDISGDRKKTANFVSGLITGSIVKSVLHPLDVYKKRLMIQGFAEARKDFGQFVSYRGLIDCAVQMIKTEGFMSMFKGLTPNVVKGALSTSLQFGFFELYLDIINSYLKNRGNV